MLRGKQLDEVIEQELQMMLVEGFEKSDPRQYRGQPIPLNS